MGLFSTTVVHKDENYYGGDTINNIKVDHTMSPEAIKQSNKIREAVIKDMLDECILQDNVLNGIVVAITASPAMDRHVTIHAKFSFNGKKYAFNEAAPKEVWNLYNTREEMIKMLVNFLSKCIAIEITKELATFVPGLKQR